MAFDFCANKLHNKINHHHNNNIVIIVAITITVIDHDHDHLHHCHQRPQTDFAARLSLAIISICTEDKNEWI